MNVEGPNSQIEYLDDLRRTCIGKSNDLVQGGILHTDDPRWMVSYDRGATWTGPYEAISILADDSSIWRCSMHATSGLGGHEIWFENLHGSDTWWSKGDIDILDFDKHKWRMHPALIADPYKNGGRVVYYLARL